MVSAESVSVKVLIPAAGVGFLLALLHADLFGVLFKIRHVVGRVAPLKNGIRGRRLLLAFPE